MVLLDELPEDSSVAQAENETWGLTNELLAQLIEEVSVLASDRRRKEPRTVDRPGHRASARSEVGLHSTGNGGQRAVGLEGMLGMARAAGAAVVTTSDSGDGDG